MSSENYPVSIYFIVANEFFGRFAFCGMRTLLSLYLRNVVLLPETMSTVVYHVFIMLCFTVPIIGAITADGCLGRFQTILLFSLICSVGHVLAWMAATPPFGLEVMWYTMVGLILVAIGAGGVKPCVAAFGGDQFQLPQQQNLLQPFFSFFYFTANLGGLMGMLTTPILRKAFSCFGDECCYSFAFGLPALLSVIAAVLFIIGRPIYRIKAPKENIMWKFICCAVYAYIQKLKHCGEESKPHWLDYAEGKYNETLIRDMKSVLAIFLLFLPLPIVWSLLVQQGSRWTFQATRMDGHIFGIELLPDQVQALSPAVVLLLIPLFNKIVYPQFEKSECLRNPLDKMAAGGLMAGLAFVCAGILEYKLQQTYPPLPPFNEGQLILVNTLPCDLHIKTINGDKIHLPNEETMTITGIKVSSPTTVQFSVTSSEDCGTQLKGMHSTSVRAAVNAGETKTVLMGIGSSGSLQSYTLAVEDLHKSLSGRPKIRLIFMRGGNLDSSTVTLFDDAGLTHFYYVGTEAIAVSNYSEINSGRYTYYVTYASKIDEEFEGLMQLRSGGVYSLILREFENKIVFADNFALTPPNYYHILWLVPQYMFISIAEVLFAISGLEFCFTQAPKSMKTVTMAAWYFTVACGNVLVILITQARLFTSQANEFFLFTFLLVIDIALFKHIAKKHNYSRSNSGQSDEQYPLLNIPSKVLTS